MMTAMIIGTGVFAGLAIFLGFGSVLTWARDRMEEMPEEEKVEGRPRWLDMLSKPFAFLGRFMPATMMDKADKMILYAGHPNEMRPEDMVGLMITGSTVSAFAGYLAARLMGWPPYIIILCGLAGTALPWMWLRDMVLKRHLRILRDLPFNIDLLTLSVEAGLDFSAAVAKMVEKGRAGPVRDEFRIMLSQIRMGKTRSQAMQAMADRVGLAQLSSFLGVLIQADRLGTGIGRVLRLQAEQMRMERSQRAEKLAGEAPVKMLLPLVMFVFPTIWLILAAPLVFQWMFR